MKILTLMEDVRSTESPEVEISESKFLELLRDRCRNSYEVVKKSPLYTHEGDYNFSIIKPAQKTRKSPFWIDRLVARFKKWSRFPSREHSLKLVHDYRRIGDDAHLVIPFDGAVLGVCSQATFYRSFPEATKRLKIPKVDNYGLQDWLHNLIDGVNQLIKADIKIEDLNNFSDASKALHQIEKTFQQKSNEIRTALKTNDHDIDPDIVNLVTDLLNKRIVDIEQYLEDVFEPVANSFDVVKIESYSQHTSDKELWTDGNCLVIKRSKYVELFKRGEVK